MPAKTGQILRVERIVRQKPSAAPYPLNPQRPSAACCICRRTSVA